MKNGPGGVVHLVKLIDAADALVAEDQSSAFQDQIVRLRILRSNANPVATRVTYAVKPTAELPFPEV